ncbi:uncharacterized protein LOC131666196 [Phymastichus coffea]|uniref:uncharacterized protein LOC131666196 n=1 Tax=Phymastichus coffea TaxID=108790 RepID=UPI00273B1782|nr:uncharacterized protein LOC131666196 [Phymastichus coffea]
MLRRLLEASARAAGQPHSNSLPTATLAPVLLHSQAAANLTAPRPQPNSSAGGTPGLFHAASTITTLVSSAQHQFQNSSLYLLPAQASDNDGFEYSILAAFSDMETVLLACISTLVPLIVALGLAFGIRHVWRKYKDRRTSTASALPWYRGVCSRHNTCESLRHNQASIQPQATQILSAQDLVNGMSGPRYICETEVMEDVGLGPSSKMQYTSPGSHTSKNTNGNIITLTLKNNHLIVETEERAVTVEDAGYQDNGCSVIVEVPPGYRNDDVEPQNQGSSSDDLSGAGRGGVISNEEQQALVHREEIPEDRFGAFDNARLFGSINTGLSQSDLSISSRDSVNPSYRYGNQLEYEAGHFGYPMYVDSMLLKVEPTTSRYSSSSNKWVEFDKSPDTEKTLLKEDDSKMPRPENDDISEMCNNRADSGGSSLEQQDSTDLSNSTDTTTTVRLNPNLEINGDEVASLLDNKPVITGALLKDEAALQEDTFQEQQRKLGNGTLTPEHYADNRPETNNKEQQQHNNGTRQPEASSFVPTHKRTGSIPPRLIEETTALEFERKKPPALDIYSQIKTSILPGLSPKFELLRNEISPVDEKES